MPRRAKYYVCVTEWKLIFRETKQCLWVRVLVSYMGKTVFPSIHIGIHAYRTFGHVKLRSLMLKICSGVSHSHWYKTKSSLSRIHWVILYLPYLWRQFILRLAHHLRNVSNARNHKWLQSHVSRVSVAQYEFQIKMKTATAFRFTFGGHYMSHLLNFLLAHILLGVFKNIPENIVPFYHIISSNSINNANCTVILIRF
jgi:hypothetical protein